MPISASEKLRRLQSQFAGEDQVLILINADPDAIASAIALKRLLWRKVAGVTIAHTNVITRPDNLTMIRLLGVSLVFIEEIVFRGYLMSALQQFLRDNRAAAGITVGVSSAVFGIAHGYQGISGVLSTGLMGVILALAYLLSGRNLWLPILLHGWVDTIGLYLIYAGMHQQVMNV